MQGWATKLALALRPLMIYCAWDFGLCPPSSVLKIIKETFQKLDLYPYSSEGMGDTYTVGSAGNGTG
jgi:hypothetical protein